MSFRWESVPAGVREQADGYVLQDRYMYAVRAVWEACRAWGLGLGEAQDLVGARYAHFGDRVARTPGSPVDLESLAARATGFPGRVVAVEAVWDGDTVHDWFVVLLAITEAPAGEHHLAAVHRDTAAAVATRAGTALADHLGVPFHFASPDRPDDSSPRRRR
ncbi:hypothetical protein EDE04_3992 [Streptomyces sp. 2132.2]|uniref:hypothetical protein n=1 Tax=Streptomyces sp. 2132.2 TaxID=2485161 RepID=UPI000F47CF8B|nr:hypothetical protein [Streptomyces sp. 2132.2]ROQ97493.1 hypothetical protein EDE04_3992 [Streptomyces sp. 2132.2]